jgi:hypothetical protein
MAGRGLGVGGIHNPMEVEHRDPTAS